MNQRKPKLSGRPYAFLPHNMSDRLIFSLSTPCDYCQSICLYQGNPSLATPWREHWPKENDREIT